MKKLLLSIFAFALVMSLGFSLPSTHAQSSTSIEAMEAQIKDLLSQINALQSKINALRGEQSQKVTQVLEIVGNLRTGDTGDEVTKLQALLSLDNDVYPERLITGYFGSLTRKAVQNFQKKYGIVNSGSEDTTGFGLVGPKTRERMRQIAKNSPLVIEDADTTDSSDGAEIEGGKKRLCLPPGHLIAPGQAKKGLSGLPSCKDPLPPGIAKLLEQGGPNGSGTGSGGNGLPVISNISVNTITQTTATVNWITNELTTSKVWYDTNPSVATTTANSSSTSGTLLNHSLVLSGLTASTTYYYMIEVMDVDGNTVFSNTMSFNTLIGSDVTAPSISNISTSNITQSGSHVLWNTNEPAEGKVWYMPSSPVSTTTASSAYVSGFLTAQDVIISGLTASTTYYFTIEATDASGNQAMSSEYNFITLP